MHRSNDPGDPEEVASTGIDRIDQAIAANYGRLSSSQRRAVDRLLSDARYGALVSAADLATSIGVSESTVTRAAQALGFTGYPDLQRHLRLRFVAPVTERLTPRASDDTATGSLFADLLMDDAARIREMAEDLSPAEIDALADSLVRARRVAIFGERGSHGLALMFGIGLRLILDDVQVLDQTAGDLPDQLLSIGAGDVVVAISFRRVDRMTVQVLTHAREAGAETIVITDHPSSPAARAAGRALIARIGALRLMPSFAPGASLVNAILEVVAARRSGVATERLEHAERLWREFGSYAGE